MKRGEALQPHKLFVQKGKIVPVSFKKAEQLLLGLDVGNTFPNLKEMSVLKADKKTKSANLRVAVLFSGGPAAGGHNVLVGLKHVLKGKLFGVRNGPEGLLNNELFEIKNVDHLINTGGFDFLGTGRKKIHTHDELSRAREVCLQHKLDGLVIIGGDDSNTNAAILADFLFEDNIKVIGVPKTMDGDLQAGKYLPAPFGFDTATKIYSELVGNLLKDVESSKKYWHFVRLMGRDASHVTLEVALQTHPTFALISEEVKMRGQTLQELVDQITDTILARKDLREDYGVVLVPEGLLEFMPEFHSMLGNLGECIRKYVKKLRQKSLKKRRIFLAKKLPRKSRNLFLSLPEVIQETLSLNRDGHGNLKVSQIPTEELLVLMVRYRLQEKASEYVFQPITHFYGYEGRCGVPSSFDSMLGYNLGLTAGSLLVAGKTGYLAGFGELSKGGMPYAIPLITLIIKENRQGVVLSAIKKQIVKKTDPAFEYLVKNRVKWIKGDTHSPGPRQLSKKEMPISVALNTKSKTREYKI